MSEAEGQGSLGFEPEDIRAFLEESWSHLEALESGLLELEEASGAPLDPGRINEMFRAAHSIKGGAGLLGNRPIGNLTHHMENLLGAVRAGRQDLLEAGADALFEGVDALRTLLVEVQHRLEGKDPALLPPFDIAPVVATLSQLMEAPIAEAGVAIDLPFDLDAQLGAALGPAARHALTDIEGKYLYELDLELVGCRRGEEGLDHPVLEKLTNLGTVLAMIPPDAGAADGPFTFEARALFLTSAEPPLLQLLLPGNEVRFAVVPVDKPEAEELEAVVPAPPVAAASPTAASETPAEGTRPVAAGAAQGKGHSGPHSVRVDVERLDLLMDVVGELVISNTRLNRIGSELGRRFERDPLVGTLNDAMAHIARLVGDLQDNVMRVRMIPVERVFSKFPRLIRDLAKRLEKEIRLDIFGQDTELDKTVVEELEDPLVHLLRNAADHGVEVPEIRTEQGKPRIGTITLEAHREGSYIVITVADDGAGIDPARILAKARTLGLVAHDSNLDEAEILQLIFLPGFSTAAKVTDVSGRGVGMDVVSQNIRKLKGKVEVVSSVGQGTKFIVKLPLTLAITRALLVASGGSVFAIPLDAVRESIRVSPSQIRTIQRREVIPLRDEVLPLLHLAEVFRPAEPLEPAQGLRPVVVVGGARKQLGLVVDSIEGEQDVVIKPLGSYLGQIAGIAGATILGDGRVSLILDIATLIDEGDKKGLELARKTEA